MRANELRIGNLVKINNDLLPEMNGETFIVLGLNERHDYEFPESTGVVSLRHTLSIRVLNQFDQFIEPIPLTVEWLMKFGFNKVIDHWIGFESYHYENKNGWIYLIEEGFEIELNILKERHNLGRTYKYVHQLQNLYFALTGEELTIKN
jgi:hypothetical protein